jgi:hypothetical protein
MRFHLETETFAFYRLLKMEGDPFWIEVTELMQKGRRDGRIRHPLEPTARRYGQVGACMSVA